MNGIKQLEREAIKALRNGQGWSEYWQQHANEVRAAEPWNRQRFKRMYMRLLLLVTSGDMAGMMPVANDPAPWLRDDTATRPHDTITHARL